MRKTPKEILARYWGYDNFRGSQAEIINAVLQNRDVLALLPTGGGKSICFQVPALIMEGICIIISPLTALIENQVNTLQSKGIKAIGLKGGLKFTEVDSLLDNCVFGNYKFLYLSPERLQQDMVQERIQNMNVCLIVIDEAHCISQWGHDFRPAYLQCAVLRKLHPNTPIIALTATATENVKQDIESSLLLEQALVKKDSFYRKNIAFTTQISEDKNYQLKQICGTTTESIIVYARSRRLVEELTSFLKAANFKATFFHGGVPQKTKTERLHLWLHDTIQIMVATNAFGMGIDKPNVGLVVHYQIPDCIENYYQEAGRAGRNGEPAQALLLHNKTDEYQVKRQFLDILPDVQFVKLVYNKLSNFFQIGYGEYTEETFYLNFNKFCVVYGFNTYLTYNALCVLERNAVISLSENFRKKITVRFKADKSTLFRYMDQNPTIENFIKTFLRTYGGIFDFDTQINSYLIASKTNLPEAIIIKNLERLAKDEIIELVNHQSDLEIIFLQSREDDKTINRFARVIKEQNALKADKIEKMLAYVNNTQDCRSIQLLDYFGEKQKEPCGICDNCTSTITLKIEPELKTKVLELLKKKTLSSRELQEALGIEQTKLILVLQDLLEDQIIVINAKNEYILK